MQNEIMLWSSLVKIYRPQKCKLTSVANLIMQWPTPLISVTTKPNRYKEVLLVKHPPKLDARENLQMQCLQKLYLGGLKC